MKTCGPFFTKENGASVLCLEILLVKALHGMIVSSLSFNRKLRKDLEKLGFNVIPFDICVPKKLQMETKLHCCGT